MTTVHLRLTGLPGRYRLALFDNQQQQVVAIGTDDPRYLHVGDTWSIGEDDEPGMVVIAPFDINDDTPSTRYEYTLVPADALEVSLPRPTVDLDTELRQLRAQPGDTT